MKKTSLLLVGLFALFSCEQEEMDNLMKSNVEPVQTRVTSSIADFNPIDELADIPVNILNVGNTSRRYLSCAKSGTKVDLFTKDDGSLRQRWYVRRGNIFLSGGNTSFSSSLTAVIAANSDSKPLLFGMMSPSFSFSSFEQAGKYYHIRGAKVPAYSTQLPPVLDPLYLQSNSQIGADLNYKITNSSSLALWNLCPVGEYELVDLQYVRTTVDNFTPKEIIYDRDTYENLSSSVVTWNYSLATQYTEASSFSETEGVSVSISNGVSVGIPSVSGSPSVNFNATIQQQSSKSWTYGKSDSKGVTRTRTANIPVQPHTTMRLEAVLFMYEGTVTYVATLRKMGDTKTFKVKGKWSGACFSEFKAKTYDVSTGNLMNSYNMNQ